jgi:hypothetical protein
VPAGWPKTLPSGTVTEKMRESSYRIDLAGKGLLSTDADRSVAFLTLASATWALTKATVCSAGRSVGKAANAKPTMLKKMFFSAEIVHVLATVAPGVTPARNQTGPVWPRAQGKVPVGSIRGFDAAGWLRSHRHHLAAKVGKEPSDAVTALWDRRGALWAAPADVVPNGTTRTPAMRNVVARYNRGPTLCVRAEVRVL